MSDAAQVAQFVDLTGATPEQATFYLESSGGNLELAASTFFENPSATSGGAQAVGDDQEMDDDDDDEQDAPVPAASAAAIPRPSAPSPSTAAAASWGGGRTLSGASAPSSATPTSSTSSTRSATPVNPFRSNAGPRVATLRDVAPSAAAPPRRMPGGDDDDSDEDDDSKDPLEFFTGGEKSGISVENPNAKKGGKSSDMIKGILQKAKEGGSRVTGLSGSGPAPPPRSVFTGSAHTLGSDNTPSQLIPGPSSSSQTLPSAPGAFPGLAGSSSSEEADSELDEPAIRNLTFWQDGFSVEDGDLMRYEDNQEILAALNSGRAPLSLLKVRHDQQVELRIAKRMNEKWTRQPSAPQGPWGGTGNRLGSELDPVVTSAPSPAAAAPSSSARVPDSVQTVFEVDANLPVTTLQIRLRDGTRMVAKFNHTHTVGDIRNYINASHPGQSSTQYALQTTFPNKDLTDDTATIKDAGLLGSVIIQRGL